MTVQMSVAARNAMLDAYGTALGASPVLRLRSGAQPANTTAADSGTVVATINMDATPMDAASNGVKAFADMPITDASADAAGVIAHYRLYTSGGVCFEQGTVTVTGGGGDMTVDNTNVNAGQQISITSWTKHMNGHA